MSIAPVIVYSNNSIINDSRQQPTIIGPKNHRSLARRPTTPSHTDPLSQELAVTWSGPTGHHCFTRAWPMQCSSSARVNMDLHPTRCGRQSRGRTTRTASLCRANNGRKFASAERALASAELNGGCTLTATSTSTNIRLCLQDGTGGDCMKVRVYRLFARAVVCSIAIATTDTTG